MENNSTEATRDEQVNELLNHFKNSGYNPRELQKLKEKAVTRTTSTTPTTTDADNNSNKKNNTLVFPIYFFEGLQEFKSMVRGMQEDFEQLIGNTKVMFATKKGSSIGNTLVRNKALCEPTSVDNNNQKCNVRGCKQCPLVNTRC